MTSLHTIDGIAYELSALQSLSELPASPHSTTLLDHFQIPGTEGIGPHLCLIIPLYGGDVRSFMLKACDDGVPPFTLAKRVLYHALLGLHHAHSRGWIHTDLKRDNIFYENRMSDSELWAWLENNPPRMHAPERSYDSSVVQAAMSQPLPITSMKKAMESTFVLGDYSCCASVSS